MACETDIRVQNEHAVRCSVVSQPTNSLEYIKTISSLVGASHVLAVFEERDSIKVFFDEKRHVDTLLRSCLHVMGRHVRVDYVVPPGVKLILSNVDPIILNYDIMRLLSKYGTIVSPIIRPPISDDIELCHISYGVRYVYMILNNGYIPDKVDFRYGDQLSYFKVNVVESLDAIMHPCIKTDTVEEETNETVYDPTVQSEECIPGPSGTNASANEETVDPILVSVQSVPGINSEEPIESLNNQISEASRESVTVGITEERVTEKKRRGRPPFRKHKRMTVVSQAAKRIKKKANGKWLKHKKSSYKHKPLTKSRCYKSVMPSNTTSIKMLVKMKEQTRSDENINKVLDKKHLLKYIDEVKGHRAPLELARKYIGDSCDSEKIYKFINQLQNFKRSQVNINLKNRVWRLVKTITDALTSENNQN